MTDPEDRDALIGRWLEKAGRAVASAARELECGDLAFAVNRCYYACFHAFTACSYETGSSPENTQRYAVV